MVNLKNKWTFHRHSVGAVCNRTGTECLINSKVYHSFPIIFIQMPELVWEKCTNPNKFGHPSTVDLHIGKFIS